MLDEFAAVCDSIEMHAPKVALVSSVHGRPLGDEVAHTAYWRNQVRQPVRFADAVAEVERQGANVWLEIGPRPILTGAARRCLGRSANLWLGSLRAAGGDWRELAASVAQLYARGVSIDWYGFDRDYRRRKIEAPTYPYQRKRYWLDTVATALRGGRSDSIERGADEEKQPDAYLELRWRPKSLLFQPSSDGKAEWVGKLPAASPETSRGSTSKGTCLAIAGWKQDSTAWRRPMPRRRWSRWGGKLQVQPSIRKCWPSG
jgi:acyl transferase domain-containing protein